MNGADSGHEPGPPNPPPRDQLGFELPAPARMRPGTAAALGLGAIALLGLSFAIGYLPRREARQELARSGEQAARALVTVDVVTPTRLESDRELRLPGSILAASETVLYPRADGYVERFEADIGDRVTEGQVLAVIETPELDQQLDQARAQLTAAEAALAQASAGRDYSRTSLERYKRLRPAGVASQQELDQRQAEALVSESNVAAASAAIEVQRAELRRLTRLKSFTRVTAPFAGLITQRTIDRGTLVMAGNATPLFKLIVSDPVRVQVQVSQDVAPSVKAGLPAKIRVREYPGRTFEGKLERAAFALDPQTRTMTTEVRVPNPDGALLVGMYAEVALSLPLPHVAYEIPATALYNDAQGLRVAVIDGENRVRYAKILIERDTGATLHISSGLRGDERVVRLASAQLHEGAQVNVRR